MLKKEVINKNISVSFLKMRFCIMALTQEQKFLNEVILPSLIEQNFSAVRNKQALTERLLALFQQYNIALNTYTGVKHLNIITSNIERVVENNLFNESNSETIVKDIDQQLRQYEEQAKKLYTQQSPENSVIAQLRTNGYLPVGNWLTHSDINQFLKKYVTNSNEIELADAISVTEDKGVALQAVFAQHKNSDKFLMIPTCINNSHWILIGKAPKGPVLCWDSLANHGPMTRWDPVLGATKETVKSIIENAAKEGYQAPVQVNYHFAGEQKDGSTCGQRICQKVLQAAKVDNAFTKVPADNPNLLSVEFVKGLIAGEPAFQAKSVVVDADAQFISLDGTDTSEIKDVLFHKKKVQETKDEYLAIALQDVYVHSPDITDQEAISRAKQTLLNEDYVQKLNQTKTKLASLSEPKLSSWSKQAAASKSSPFFKKYRDEVEKLEEQVTGVGLGA